MNVVVIGAGSFGTALAGLSAQKHRTMVWARRADFARELSTHYENKRYLPGITLPRSLMFTADINDIMQHAFADNEAPLFILAVPVAGLRSALLMLRDAFQRCVSQTPIHMVWTCKGLTTDTAQLPHQVVDEVLGHDQRLHTGVLSGPSFAREVAQGLPVALTVASVSPLLADSVVHGLHQDNCRVYYNQDIVGVEVGGAVKNIMALACGIGDGLGLGSNARAAIITRGLVEMTRLGVALGAKPETFQGLTGLGDLVLTATGDLSRNRKVGLAIGQGQSLASILAEMPHVAEGVNCAKVVLAIAQQYGVSMPITEAVCKVLFDHVAPKIAVSALMSRDPRPE